MYKRQLHEFLPNAESLAIEINTLKVLNKEPEKQAELEKLLAKVRSLHEANPMLGTRGCRLGIRYPEIYRMQARACLLYTSRGHIH